jgi:hypothetical protein
MGSGFFESVIISVGDMTGVVVREKTNAFCDQTKIATATKSAHVPVR